MPPAMGQPITVVQKPSPRPGIARFETNRSLTGMGHERYRSADDILSDRPVDELARRLFATGGVTAVHVNSSMITVELLGGWEGDQLVDAISGLYIYYPAVAANGSAAEAAEGEGEVAAPEAADAPEAAAEPAEATDQVADEAPAPEPAAVVAEPPAAVEPATDAEVAEAEAEVEPQDVVVTDDDAAEPEPEPAAEAVEPEPEPEPAAEAVEPEPEPVGRGG